MAHHQKRRPERTPPSHLPYTRTDPRAPGVSPRPATRRSSREVPKPRRSLLGWRFQARSPRREAPVRCPWQCAAPRPARGRRPHRAPAEVRGFIRMLYRYVFRMGSTRSRGERGWERNWGRCRGGAVGGERTGNLKYLTEISLWTLLPNEQLFYCTKNAFNFQTKTPHG